MPRTDVLAPLLSRTTTVHRYTEHEAALAACGIFESEGIAVVAGTGSSAVAMRDGKRNVAGGWGALLGDEGSAYDIAMWAIRAAIRSSEGTGPSIPLLERRVTAHFGVRRLERARPALLFRPRDAGRDRRSVPGHRAGRRRRTP